MRRCRTPWMIGVGFLLAAAGGFWSSVEAADATAPAEGAAAVKPLQSLPYTPALDPMAMDTNTSACTDFYQYACGGWIKNNPIPSDQASWSVYGKLYRDNQRFLWGILDQLAQRTLGRTETQAQLGDYFAACMDVARIDRLGRTPLEPVLASIAALESKQDLPRLLAALHLRGHGGGFFFSFGSNQDFANSADVIAFATAGGLGMPDRDYYVEKTASAGVLRRKYRDHVARTFQLLGDPTDTAERNAATVLRLESQLAHASFTRVQQRDPRKLMHRLEPTALQRLTPHFNWTDYLAALHLHDVAIVNVSEPVFYGALDRLLSAASLEDLKVYLRWHAAHAAAASLSAPFEDERFAFFDHELRGVLEQKPRWNRCVRDVDARLGESLGREFVERTFGSGLKASTLKMTLQIEAAMRDDIEHLSWMSNATKREALAKLHAVVNKIGYPDRWRDYRSIVVDREDYFGNVARAREFESQRQLDKIGRPLDRTEWGMTPQTVNAYYDPQMNDINFPAGVLQPPLYDPALDEAPNYGDTGGTIGHELTHGFDDEGRQFDDHGNLRQWWTAEDSRRFDERAKCIVDQYAGYLVVDDVHINSRLTLGEDIADLGGLILAHVAWRAQTGGQQPPSADGLAPEQRFFVGYAQWACENERPENLRIEAKTDPHSPGRYRVNGVVANMPEFQRAFSCPTGSPMVNRTPCRLW